MIRHWKKSPGLRLFLPFMAGIVADQFMVHDALFWASLLAPFLIICFVVYWRVRRWRFVYRFAPGLAIVPVLFCFGALLNAVDDPLRSSEHYVHQYRPENNYVVRIISVPVIREKSVRMEAEVIGILRPDHQTATFGKIILTFENDSTVKSLELDDLLAISAKIKSHKKPANPGEFDYGEFLLNREIYRQAYVRKEEWKLVDRPSSHGIKSLFLIWREFFIEKFRGMIDGEEEFSVLAALILGKTEFIDQDMMQAYASAGAIHILAVSGLHVGLIYVVLAPLLRRLFPGKSRKWVRFLIPASILWMYAGVTGFSPSVLRAALMFTAFIVAETWEQNSSSYNTIGISAFLLLCWQPEMTYELGFQLSYLAVLGIIMLQKKISDVVPIHPKWLQKIWQLTAVTLAAQITTFPLSMYYFHQFPVYFVFSNLIVIPISTVLLYAGLVFILLCWMPYVSDVVANICSTITSCMNGIILWFDQLPFSTWRGFAPGILETLLLYALMWTVSSWLFWKNRRSLIFSCVLIMILAIVPLIKKEYQNDLTFCCVHSIRDHPCLSLIDGDIAYILTDSAMIADPSLKKFHLDNFLHTYHIGQTTYIDVNKLTHFEAERFQYDNGILRTPEFTLGWLDCIDTGKPLIADPEIMFIETLESSKKFSAEELAYLKTKSLVLGNSFYDSQASIFLNKESNASSVYLLKDGAAMVDNRGISHYRDWQNTHAFLNW